MFNEPENTGEIQVIRDEGGRFIEGKSGNIKGKPPGTKNYLTQLEEALEEEAKKAGVTYWEKLAQWCFRNPTMAAAILKKFIPDLKSLEIKDSGQDQLRIIIMSRGYSHAEQDFIDEHIKEWREQTKLPFIIKDDPNNELKEEEKLILKKEKETKALEE